MAKELVSVNVDPKECKMDDGYFTGIATAEIDEDDIISYLDVCFDYKDDSIDLHIYSEPGYFTGASYEMVLPDIVKENFESFQDAILNAYDEYGIDIGLDR